MAAESRCKTCGAPILWVKSPNGANLPLDLKAPVYIVDRLAEEPLQSERATDAFVSHFKTCPNASQHSRKGRPQQGELL